MQRCQLHRDVSNINKQNEVEVLYHTTTGHNNVPILVIKELVTSCYIAAFNSGKSNNTV